MSNGAAADVARPEKPKAVIKIVLAGNVKVGKTSFIHRYMNDHFNPHTMPTIGLEFACRDIRMSNGELVVLQLWDTAGQEVFRAMTRSFYRNAAGAALLYDVTDESTFRGVVEYWLPTMREYGREGCVLLLVGNKYDLVETSPKSRRRVSTAEAQAFADANGMLFVETSARTGYKVEEAVMQLFEETCRKLSDAAKAKQAAEDVIRLDNAKTLESAPAAGHCGC